MSDLFIALQQHYSLRPVLPLIHEQLRRKGIDRTEVRPEDLYPYDQSHAGGIVATRLLAERAAIEPHSFVVDVGCGFGSSSRFLHAEHSCRVLGVDLTPSRIDTAIQLTRLVRILSGVEYVVGSALSLPLASGVGDFVWTQHVTMNLPDHRAFVSECARVLKPSGRLASHEWLRRESGELPFPLPWASAPPLNHAIEATQFLNILRENQFEPQVEDVTEAMRAALATDLTTLEEQNYPAERTTPLKNLIRAAGEGLVGCWMIVARKC
ncbi:MAG: class I SAM-dependent methyltransferase [Acidobacteria bacterium]|nr:class I SAM-dependent methyltransferase [Acidobacteriota bacterium]